MAPNHSCVIFQAPRQPPIRDLSAWLTKLAVSTNQHGDEAVSGDAALLLQDSYQIYNRAGLPWVEVGNGGALIGAGRLEDVTIADDGMNFSALGPWRALDDLPYTALWSSTSVAGFRPMTDNEGTASTTPMPDRYSFDTNNRIYISPNKNATLGNTTVFKAGMQCYQIPDQSGRDIIGAQFDFEFVVPAANWRAAFQNRNADFSGIANPWLITSAGAGTTRGSVHVTFAACKVINFFMDFNAADAVYAGESGATYLRITNLRFVTTTTNRINTTLSVARTNGAGVTCSIVGSTSTMYIGQRLIIGSGAANSESVTILSIPTGTTFTADIVNAPGGGYPVGTTVQAHMVFANEIVADMRAAISATNSAQIVASDVLIASPGLDLTDETYEDESMSQIADRLALLGDTTSNLWEVGIGRDRFLYFRRKGSKARSWFVDVSTVEIQRTLQSLFNSTYAIYKDSSDRILRTAIASDAASVSRFAVTRRQSVDAQTTSSATAGLIRDTSLADTSDAPPRSAITFTALYDQYGARWPLWEAVAGDTITIRNLPAVFSNDTSISTFRIARTEYDVIADVLNVEPEQPIPRLDVLLARRDAGIRR